MKLKPWLLTLALCTVLSFSEARLAQASDPTEIGVSFKTTIAFQNYFFNLELPSPLRPEKSTPAELNAQVQKLIARAMETQNFKEIVQQCQAKYFNATAVVTSIKLVYTNAAQINISCVRYESWEVLSAQGKT